MGGLLVGFALGAMAFTEQGREIGNMIGSTAFTTAKKAIKNVSENKPAKQPSGAAWNDSSHS